jgi:hypothetical protein
MSNTNFRKCEAMKDGKSLNCRSAGQPSLIIGGIARTYGCLCRWHRQEIRDQGKQVTVTDHE